MATTNDLKNGMTLNIDGQLWTVVEFQHVKPGKGGAFVRTKLKNVLSGKVVDKTFNAGVKVEVANVDQREMQYLYREGDDFVFMDTEDYDQPTSPRRTVGDAANYLLEKQIATVAFNEGAAAVRGAARGRRADRRQTDPGLQGDRSTGGTKPATLETGAQIQVPLFITTGEKIKVDTRTGEYLGRVNPRCQAVAHAARRASGRSTSSSRPSCAAEHPLEILAERGRPRGAAGQRVHRRRSSRASPAHRDRIDELIATYSEGWTLDRMPAVDRNILRIGTYELLWMPDVPEGVVDQRGGAPGHASCPRTSRRSSSTACWPASSSSSPV